MLIVEPEKEKMPLVIQLDGHNHSYQKLRY